MRELLLNLHIIVPIYLARIHKIVQRGLLQIFRNNKDNL